MNVSALAAEECEVPPSFIASDNDAHACREVNQETSTGWISPSSAPDRRRLPGPDGEKFAYPARLQEALQRLLPGNDIKVVAHVQPRQTTADMAAGLKEILAEDKPALGDLAGRHFRRRQRDRAGRLPDSLAEGVDTINAPAPTSI